MPKADGRFRIIGGDVNTSHVPNDRRCRWPKTEWPKADGRMLNGRRLMAEGWMAEG
ncbi:unnamed protein product [Prunus armeniaca]